MTPDKKSIQVVYKSDIVGRLAQTRDRKIAFQYDKQWLSNGFSISPFSLPPDSRVFIPDTYNFDGLFGVFADSLPDAWGRLVIDRMLAENGIEPAETDVLDRLSIVGSGGMGALEYVPEYSLPKKAGCLSLDELSEECSKLLESKSSDKLNELFNDCGSSGGARPKALLKIEGDDWIIKFPYSRDGKDSGMREYAYALCAKECGIDMSEVRLFETDSGNKFFGTKRFDRPKKHMISAAAILEVDFERSLIDYSDLFKLTRIVTNENKSDIKDLFRRMCFNVFSENQDDHLKNFSFLYEDAIRSWRLSPAYDLTHCITWYGEHTSTVNGKGKNISDSDLLKVGVKAGLKSGFCLETIDMIKEKCTALVSTCL